jgi:prepilin-type processing-associated H-X9-DG protein
MIWELNNGGCGTMQGLHTIEIGDNPPTIPINAAAGTTPNVPTPWETYTAGGTVGSSWRWHFRPWTAGVGAAAGSSWGSAAQFPPNGLQTTNLLPGTFTTNYVCNNTVNLTPFISGRFIMITTSGSTTNASFPPTGQPQYWGLSRVHAFGYPAGLTAGQIVNSDYCLNHFVRTVGRVPNLSNTILFLDYNKTSGVVDMTSSANWPSYLTDVGARHPGYNWGPGRPATLGLMNVCFADGHVETADTADYNPNATAFNNSVARNWNPPE